MTTTVLRAARHDDRPSGLDARRSVLRGWDFLLALGVPLLGASGCYADVLAGAQRPLGTTTPEFEAPAWNLGVAVGVMSDFANYTDGYLDDKLSADRAVDSYLTFDIQASYNFPYQVKLTVGCLNVTDEMPPLVVAAFADSYDRDLHDIRQRFWYVQVSKKF